MLRLVVLIFFMALTPAYAANANCQALLKPNANLSKDVIDSLSLLSPAFLEGHGKDLFFDVNSPTIGNSKGKVTLVEFFDYQCSYCKQFSPVLIQMSAQPKLRIVFKELPIFGPASEAAAVAALAADKQGKYLSLHEKLIQSLGLTQAKVTEISQQVGVTPEIMLADKNRINDEVAQNLDFMEQLHLVGTPSFVIAKIQAEQLDKKDYGAINAYNISAAVSISELKELVKQFVEAQC